MVIPVINCPDFETAKERIKKTATFFPRGDGWFHLDVADGKFTSYINWGDPEELKNLQLKTYTLNFEVHLMVEKPEAVIEDWLKAGAARVIVHLQAITDLDFLLKLTGQYRAELMISVDPSVPVEAIRVYLDKVNSFHVLAVFPGPSGQKFQKEALVKIRFLRDRSPNAKIEVDGGIDPETGKLVKEAGADILAAGDYIFLSDDPEEAYYELTRL